MAAINQDTSASSSYYETAREEQLSGDQSLYSDIETTSIYSDNDENSDVNSCGMGFDKQGTGSANGDNLIYDSVTDGEATPRPTTVLTVNPASTNQSPTLTQSICNNIPQTMADFSPSRSSNDHTIAQLMDMVGYVSGDLIRVVDSVRMMEHRVEEMRSFVRQLQENRSSLNFSPTVKREPQTPPEQQLTSTPQVTSLPIPVDQPLAKKPKVTRLANTKHLQCNGAAAKIKRTPVRLTPKATNSNQTTGINPTLISGPPKPVRAIFRGMPIEELKCRFSSLPSMVKGYLARRLLSTEKVKDLIWTVRDTAKELAVYEVSDEPTKAELDIHHMMMSQLDHSQGEIYHMMIESSVQERMSLIRHSRESLRSGRTSSLGHGPMALTLSKILSSSRPVKAPDRRPSSATQKTIQRKSNHPEQRAASSPPYLKSKKPTNKATVTKSRPASSAAGSSRQSSSSSLPTGRLSGTLATLRSKGAVSKIVESFQPFKRPIPEPRPRKTKSKKPTCVIEGEDEPTASSDVQGMVTRRSSRRRTYSLPKKSITSNDDGSDQ